MATASKGSQTLSSSNIVASDSEGCCTATVIGSSHIDEGAVGGITNLPNIAMKEINTKNGTNAASRRYTDLPVPAQLSVKPSGIPGTELGVFAEQFIHQEVEMGPYEGKIVEETEENKEAIKSITYGWKVSG